MNKRYTQELFGLVLFALAIGAIAAGCVAIPVVPQATTDGSPRVLAIETFLADIAQNVAGDRLVVEALMPEGVDPHSFQPSPNDVARIAQSDLVIINKFGFEESLEDVIRNADGDFLIVEAAAGLVSRTEVYSNHQDKEAPDHEDEVDRQHDEDKDHDEDEAHTQGEHQHEGDPHFWLDPINVITYIENIRDGLTGVDPGSAEIYSRNAEAYVTELRNLDAWIAAKVEEIPVERRLLVTNHESFGYFADRYGFTISGTIIPSATTGASPSARELAALADQIRETGAPAIFLETGANPRLAEQLAHETGIKIAPELYSHSTGDDSGPASTYIEMMKYNTTVIVESLR